MSELIGHVTMMLVAFMVGFTCSKRGMSLPKTIVVAGFVIFVYQLALHFRHAL